MIITRTHQTDFFNPTHFNNLIERVKAIEPSAERKWGKMSISEMLHHLNIAIGSGLGYYSAKDHSNIFTHFIIRPFVLNFLKGMPIGSKAPKPLKVNSILLDFDKEKNQLLEILQRAYQTTNDNDWSVNSYFGKLSRKDWGKLIMIHCNHHFTQFGC
jgi:hypothetical protein